METKKRMIRYEDVYQYAFTGANGGSLEDEDFDAIVNAIEAVPTVDAVEVVHGRWISWEEVDNFIPSPDRHECSVCHDAAQVLVNGLELLSPYCPNCGAKMDL